MAKRSLGTLTVDLIVKMGGFEQGMSRASRETKKRMREIQNAVDAAARRVRNFALAGAAVMATGAAITSSLVNTSRQAIDTQAKLARSLNTTVDSLTALQLRAGDSGIDKLDMSLNRMNRRLGAAEFGTGAALKTVEKLKLDLDAMRNMDVDEKIGYIGDRIDEMGVSSEEAARHLQQLGFEQAAAIELFRDGSSQVERYRREVDDLGLSMSDLDAKKVEEMNDALGIFKDLQQSVGQQLTIGLASTVKTLAETMERAWIHTENMGLAGVDFELKFRASMASALDSASTVVTFMERHGEMMTSYGLVGYFLLGRRGLLIGSMVGSLISSVKQQLGFGVDAQAAELARLENRIESLQALMGADGIGHAPNRDAQITAWRQRKEELEAQADALRVSMSDEAWADMDQYFSDSEDRAEGLAHWLRVAADELRNEPDIPESSPRMTPSAAGEDPAREQEILDLYTSQSEALLRQIALYGDTSLAAQMRYDMEHGAMAELSTEQQEILMVYAQQLDYLKELEEANQKAQEEAKTRAALMDQFTTQAARNMQTTLADYLFDPFDEGVKGMLRSFGEMMRQMAAEVASAAILRTLFGGFAASSNPIISSIGSSFAGLRDGGGYIPPGGWAIAGEIGPEIVRGPAMITSRSESSQQLGGAGATQIIVHAEDPGAEARIRAIVEASAPQFISAAIGQTVARLKRPRLA